MSAALFPCVVIHLVHLAYLCVHNCVWILNRFSIVALLFHPPPPVLHSSSKDAVKSGWVQFSWVVREHLAHTQVPYIPWTGRLWRKETKRGTVRELEWLIHCPYSVKNLLTNCNPTHSGGTNRKMYILSFLQFSFFSSNSAMQWEYFFHTSDLIALLCSSSLRHLAYVFLLLLVVHYISTTHLKFVCTMWES